jgi:hypothetical protein
VDGNVSTQFDDVGHAIDVKNHRSVFLLKHRTGRREPFNPQSKDARERGLSPEATCKALAGVQSPDQAAGDFVRSDGRPYRLGPHSVEDHDRKKIRDG